MLLLTRSLYGVTTMTCCVMLALTGVFDISTAFSGLANKTTILIACMFTVAYAFGKRASLINKVRNSMERIKGKKAGLGLSSFFIPGNHCTVTAYGKDGYCLHCCPVPGFP